MALKRTASSPVVGTGEDPKDSEHAPVEPPEAAIQIDSGGQQAWSRRAFKTIQS